MTSDRPVSTPYTDLPPSRYWRSAVADRHPLDMEDLYSPRFPIGPADRIAVAGSCFAQHVGRALKASGFSVIDQEPPPEDLDRRFAETYGYGIYSARYGNIYTARQLLQLLKDSQAGTVREGDFWTRDGRYYDALRPSVEPTGLDSLAEAMAHRSKHLGKVRAMLERTDIFIFTLGLTEAWRATGSGVVYPTCPGVVAGQFDDETFAFVNFDFVEILQDMIEVRTILKAINPAMRFLFTVSPVPLAATASGQNVLVATTYSKSVLRAVCGSLCNRFDDIDYFPSYEIIASPSTRGFFYEPNMRSVNPHGVKHVMQTFLKAHGVKAGAGAGKDGKRQKAKGKRSAGKSSDNVICEEALLEAFA
ncbi:GSCFA domain-containing protein [Rhizobium sp. GN54]|uniref:GSCFA domain-containing protein n=1 Tax=Rhizobium sp. GN54 TaxID=2898150 RepID=UPI001E4DA4EF|nr:GSCFA domain-containing protein [Rhizobium sp. GN54]MCD2181237.1 GSCFA domain-containing protein [Rhizobium sp. GN54]